MYRAPGLHAAERFLLLVMCLISGTHGRAAERPNVLLILADDLNDWVGFLEGHPQTRTPNLDRLAQRGVVFANAHCAAPLCCPSRAALFSGRQPFNTGVYDNDQNIRQHHPELVLLPQYFAKHGYRTLGTGKLLHHASPNLYDDYYATEQRWSPLRDTKEAAYTPEELGAIRAARPANRSTGAASTWRTTRWATPRSQVGRSNSFSENRRTARSSRSCYASVIIARTSRSERRKSISICFPFSKPSCRR
jgi:arylsulfatase A-like enzyme